MKQVPQGQEKVCAISQQRPQITIEMIGHIGMESVDSLQRNEWSLCGGICTKTNRPKQQAYLDIERRPQLSLRVKNR